MDRPDALTFDTNDIIFSISSFESVVAAVVAVTAVAAEEESSSAPAAAPVEVTKGGDDCCCCTTCTFPSFGWRGMDGEDNGDVGI